MTTQRILTSTAVTLCLLHTSVAFTPSHHYISFKTTNGNSFTKESLPLFQRTWHLPSTTTTTSNRHSRTSRYMSSTQNKQETISSTTTNSKLAKLKDRMWVREALEDLTSAEFACSIGIQVDTNNGKKNKVDFENIVMKLDQRIEDMCTLAKDGEEGAGCLVTYPLVESESDGEQMESKDVTVTEAQCWVLKKDCGMGSVTYSDEQRDALVR